MKIKEYEEVAHLTYNSSFTKKESLSNWALGLVGEAGEVSELIKKHLYHGHELDSEKLKLELGDVLWYLSTLAYEAGITLEDVAIANSDKLLKRYGGRFSKEKSIHRES